ncbi:MAG: metal-dependent hydrolase [Dethiobacteria bacterium]|jgi:inner membrane protein
MDTFTHAIVGLGVGALSGQPLSPYNPVYCATVVGAVMPDIDIVTLLQGEYALVKHHRGPTHSIGGLLLLAAAVAGIIHLDFGLNPLPYFFWALGGTLSHGLLDYLNSYGIQIWWPFQGKRYAGNLLMFFDPVLFMLFVPILVHYRNPFKTALLAFVGVALHLFLRWKIRLQAAHFLRKKYKPQTEYNSRLALMPALKGILRWDFMIEKQHEIIVGTLDFLSQNVSSCRHLNKIMASPLISKALQTVPARLFCQFTSYYFVTEWQKKGKYYVKLADLRFKYQSDFLYKLTFIFNEQHLLEEAYFCRQNNFVPLDIS